MMKQSEMQRCSNPDHDPSYMSALAWTEDGRLTILLPAYTIGR
jgi:hypothetical protein